MYLSNATNVYIGPLHATVTLVQALVGVDLNDPQNFRSSLNSDKDIVTKDILKRVLVNLTKLLQTERYNFITKVILTICFPFQLLKEFALFSMKEKLEFHVIIDFKETF